MQKKIEDKIRIIEKLVSAKARQLEQDAKLQRMMMRLWKDIRKDLAKIEVKK